MKRMSEGLLRHKVRDNILESISNDSQRSIIIPLSELPLVFVEGDLVRFFNGDNYQDITISKVRRVTVDGGNVKVHYNSQYNKPTYSLSNCSKRLGFDDMETMKGYLINRLGVYPVKSVLFDFTKCFKVA